MMGPEDSPTLSTHSVPGRQAMYLHFSDEDSLSSSCEYLNEVPYTGLKRVHLISGSDSHDSLSDMSPVSAPGDFPRTRQSVNFGKKRRAPLPPVHVSMREPVFSARQQDDYMSRDRTQDDFYLERRLSRIEEDIDIRRRPTSSYEVPSITVQSMDLSPGRSQSSLDNEMSPRLSSSQKFRMKAAMILSLHSPKINRKDDNKKSKRKKLLNSSFEEILGEDVGYCYISPDLHIDGDFEVGQVITLGLWYFLQVSFSHFYTPQVITWYLEIIGIRIYILDRYFVLLILSLKRSKYSRRVLKTNKLIFVDCKLCLSCKDV